jgi:hypothetical protein
MGFIQDLLLSEFIIFFALFGALAVLSRWALLSLKEYLGYGLGWMLGLFFVIVYSSLTGDPEPVMEAQAIEIGGVTLTAFQVFLPSVLGFALGAGLMVIIALGRGKTMQQALKIAGLTALNLILIFLMFVTDETGRRMIGLFALAFGIGTVLAMVMARGRQSSNDSDDDGNDNANGDTRPRNLRRGVNRVQQIRRDLNDE